MTEDKAESAAIQFIPCTFAEQAQIILEIFNDAIANSTALYEYKPRTLDDMARWFQAKADGGFPVIGAVSQSGEFLGFASWGSFRAFPAYKYTVEHSVYVHPDHRGRGVGTLLLAELIREAELRPIHCLIGAIDANNAASIAIHERQGFVRVGTMPQVGYKFGNWLDLALYQKTLTGPQSPADG